MSVDLTTLLNDWPYEPGRLSGRRIAGCDGVERIQLRVDMGVAQFESTGRPDGELPYGSWTLLDHYRRALDAFIRRCGTDLGYSLPPGACDELRYEAALYYQRYLCFFVLEEFVHAAVDASHVLAIIDLCERYAAADDDREAILHFRPYLLTARARALALAEMVAGRPAQAFARVNDGLYALLCSFRRADNEDCYRTSPEVHALEGLRLTIGRHVTQDPRISLRRLLNAAVHEERYEDAAFIRDELGQRAHRRQS